MLAVAATLGISGFAAGEAAAAGRYGAIAFSQSTGAWGSSSGYASRGGAEERALQECGPSCGVTIWWRDACAALAVGRGNGYGTYWSTSRSQAINGAINQCSRHTSGCRLTAIAC